MPKPTTSFDALPRREQNRARTRLALVEALLAALSTQRLDEIPVAGLAQAAGISQATFFNHFPSKEHLLTFFLQVWSLDMGVLDRALAGTTPDPLERIEAIFLATAETVLQAPNVMLEIIAWQARRPADRDVPPLSRGIRMLRHPEVEDPLSLPDRGFESVIPPLLAQAKADGLLPAGIDEGLLFLALTNIFFGVPLVMARRQPGAVGPLYSVQLALLWSGARSLGTPPPG